MPNHGLPCPTPYIQDSMFNMMKQMMASNPAMSKRLRREQPLMWASMQRDERIPPLHKEVEGAERCVRKSADITWPAQ